MKKLNFSLNWQRSIGVRQWFQQALDTESVNLPDDFIINSSRHKDSVGGASTGFFDGGYATYSKKFTLSDDLKGKNVFLYIDGAYMNAEVKLNSNLLTIHPYGYTPFFTDLTSYLKADNDLSITLDAEQPSSRWYSGGGIYRQVELYTAGSAYIHPWDIFVRTASLENGKALIKANIHVTNTESAKNLTVKISLDGKIYAQLPLTAAQGKTEVQCEFTVENPILWDDITPNLYNLSVGLYDENNLIDTEEMDFGIRLIEIDVENGMRVNGRTIKLRGGCLHHDNTLIGARANPAAEQRKLMKLKQAGYNAVRTAHNPPSKEFLKICDRLGLYVLDETFDCWRIGKNIKDYHKYFEDWWQRDTAAMVLRDRNHPSVYCFSIGNEIMEMNSGSNGEYWSRVQADFVRSLDPTRPVTQGMFPMLIPQDIGPTVMQHMSNMKRDLENPVVSNGYIADVDCWGDATAKTTEPLDIVGYNYLWPRYKGDKIKFPNRIIHATETHAWHMYDYWQAVLENNHVLGDYTWTATDNLGEAGAGRVMWDISGDFAGLTGAWPWLSCNQGDFDLNMERRPQSYYRGIVWGLDKNAYMFTTHPNKTGKPFYGMGWHWQDVQPSWSFDPAYIGKSVKVEVYCDCDQVDFILNGKKVATAKPEKYIASALITYSPGELCSVAYLNGKEVSRAILATTGKACAIKINAEQSKIKADGIDLAYVTISTVDENGNLVQTDNIQFTVTAQGDGVLIGLGSSNPCTDENYGTGKRLSFGGKVLACLRSTENKGQIKLTATAQGFEGAEIIITTI